MSKYIIDTDQFEKLFETKAVAVLGIGDNLAVPEEGEKTVWTRMLNVADLEELNSDYINEHFGDLQDTAYQKGFEDGVTKRTDGDVCAGCEYKGKTGEHLPCDYCMNNFKNQWTSDKIEVGDEVADKDGNKTIVTNIHGDLFDGLCSDGSTMADLFLDDTRKTNRHFDIKGILEDMKHD